MQLNDGNRCGRCADWLRDGQASVIFKIYFGKRRCRAQSGSVKVGYGCAERPCCARAEVICLGNREGICHNTGACCAVAVYRAASVDRDRSSRCRHCKRAIYANVNLRGIHPQIPKKVQIVKRSCNEIDMVFYHYPAGFSRIAHGNGTRCSYFSQKSHGNAGMSGGKG